MAYNVDFMANPYEGYEDEETRRKRLEEQRKAMGETEVGKTEVTTYADGSQTRTVTQEIPRQQTVMRPGQEGQFMRPVLPIAPQGIDQRQYIQRMESGNRPDIGYHGPNSSAYGKYGITNAAYQDIQRANPQFAGRPITSLSPEEQDQAYQTYTNLNARALQQYGIEPNAANQRLAHFLGAKGAANYLNTGQISPQAAQANFGEARARQIAEQRLAGGMAPASAAARQPVQQRPTSLLTLANIGAGAEGTEGELQAQQRLQQYNQNFLANQDNIQNLIKLKDDPSTPSNIQTLASDRAFELMNTERNKQLAEREGKQILQTNDTKKIGNILSSDPEDEKGSYLKLFFLGFVSPESARMEASKLGLVPSKYESAVITNSDGTTKAVQVKTRADGKVTGGIDMFGNTLSSEDLGKAISQTTGKNVTTGAEAYRDSTTGKIFYRQNDQRGNIFFTEPGGARFSGDTSKLQRVTDVSALQRIDYQTTSDLFKKHQGNISEVVKEYGIKLGRPLSGEEYQQVVQMVGPGTARPTAQAPAQPAVPQAQVAQPQAQPAVPQPTTVAPTQQGVGVSTSPLPTLGSLERAGTIATAAQKQFVEKTVPTIAEDANNARQVAGTRREQLDIIRTNPSILDIYNGSGSGYDQARNVITKIVTGVYNADNQDQLFKDIKNISIQPNERAALEQFANLNMTVNPKTLRANAGPGAVSNAEQQANQKANIQNVAELTPLAALQGIYRSKFMSELADAKEAFLSKNQDTYKTDADFNRAWAKEQNKWFKAHEAIAQARAEYLKPFNPGPKASREELNAFRDKVFKAFEIYPSPTFDTSSGWSYGTKNAEREIVKKWRESGALK